MAEQMFPKDGEFQTVIGADACFKGELSFEKSVKIEGRFEGKIDSPGKLLICQEGKVQAEVKAASIAVDGEVNGNMDAKDRVELRATARITGDVRAGKLMVAEGAVLIGHCQVGAEDKKAKAEPKPVAAPVASQRQAEAPARK